MAAIQSVTFEVSSTVPDNYAKRYIQSEYYHRPLIETTATQQQWFTEGSSVLASSPAPPSHRAELKQGLADALYLSYAKHLDLILSPDDLWLTILLSLNNYMQYHAEAMRSQLVNHEGKLQLIIHTEEPLTNRNWPAAIALFNDKIKSVVKPELTDWLLPDFTTSTETTRTVATIALMGIMKSYFAFGDGTMCGIPRVTLQGTLEDWQKLKARLIPLAELGPDFKNWAAILTPILDQFIVSYTGKVNVKWWNSVVHHHGESGGDSLSGWLLAFFPFQEGRWKLNPVDKILRTREYGNYALTRFEFYSSVHVPVKHECLGVETDLMYYAESSGVTIGTAGVSETKPKETPTIQPVWQYAIAQLPPGSIPEVYDWLNPGAHKVKAVQHRCHPHPLQLQERFDHCGWCYARVGEIYICTAPECARGWERVNMCSQCVFKP